MKPFLCRGRNARLRRLVIAAFLMREHRHYFQGCTRRCLLSVHCTMRCLEELGGAVPGY
jgi:hypothetical protein